MLIAVVLVLSACAPTETEVASSDLPTVISTTEITVEALQPLPSPSATPPATPTAIETAIPEPTKMPEPSNTPTPEPVEENTATPTAAAEKISADSKPTIEPIEATQIIMTPTPASEPRASFDVPSSLQPIVDEIVEDIFGRINVDRSTITLTSYEAVTWPNGAIGCPQPGYAYTQALVGGYRFIFNADGQQMLYHTAGTENFVYCDTTKVKPDAPVEGSSGDT